MKLFSKIFGRKSQKDNNTNDINQPIVCKMSALVDIIRLEDLKDAFLDIVVFEYKGTIHREGMVLSDKFVPQKTAYLFDNELYSDLESMINHTCLSDYEAEIRILGFGQESDGKDSPPYKVVYDIRCSDDYQSLDNKL